AKSERLPPVVETANLILRRAMPSIFITGGYARLCQAKVQPSILGPDEEPPEGRQVLEYPAPQHRGATGNFLRLWCANDTAPYPNIINNTTRSRGEIKYLPCCSAHDQMNDPTSVYTQIYANQED